MKSIIRYTFTVLFFLISFGQAFGEEKTFFMKGTVVDYTTQESIENVNVFLSKTTFNTTSDKDGRYMIEDILPGNYDMVFSADGYESVVVNVNIRDTEVIEIDAFLVKETSTEETVPSDRINDNEWKENLERFKEIFLGSTSNAENSEIINPEVLSFEVDNRNRLSASTDNELQIINNALGYELFVTIQSFSWDLRSDTGQFLNLIRMKELKPASAYENSKWMVNRAATFDESLRKFLYTLTQDSPARGAGAYTYNYVPGEYHSLQVSSTLSNSYGVKMIGPQSGKFVEVSNQETVNKVFPEAEFSDIHLFEIQSNYREVAVVPNYNRPIQFDELAYDYLNRGYLPNPAAKKLSYIGHTGDKNTNNYLVVDRYGNLLNPLDITISGYWSQHRLADFLPFNYQRGYEGLTSM